MWGLHTIEITVEMASLKEEMAVLNARAEKSEYLERSNEELRAEVGVYLWLGAGGRRFCFSPGCS